MGDHDVRDLPGRVRRVWQSVVIGIAGSLAITLVLPTRDHFPTEPGGCGFSHQDQGWLVEGGSPSIMIAGAIAIAIGAYALLGAVGVRRVGRIPRAIGRYTSTR